MALKTKNPRCLNLWHVGFGTSNLFWYYVRCSLKPEMDVSRHIQQSHGQQIVWQEKFMLSLKYAIHGNVSTELRRHIVDSAHLFFGCTGARFGYAGLFVFTAQSRYIHSAQLAESGCFCFRHIYIVRFVSSGMAYAEAAALRSEEHTSELQSPCNLVCRLLLE